VRAVDRVCDPCIAQADLMLGRLPLPQRNTRLRRPTASSQRFAKAKAPQRAWLLLIMEDCGHGGAKLEIACCRRAAAKSFNSRSNEAGVDGIAAHVRMRHQRGEERMLVRRRDVVCSRPR